MKHHTPIFFPYKTALLVRNVTSWLLYQALCNDLAFSTTEWKLSIFVCILLIYICKTVIDTALAFRNNYKAHISALFLKCRIGFYTRINLDTYTGQLEKLQVSTMQAVESARTRIEENALH